MNTLLACFKIMFGGDKANPPYSPVQRETLPDDTLPVNPAQSPENPIDQSEAYPMRYLRRSKRKIGRLIFHHFGPPPPSGTNVRSIRKMHTDEKPHGRGWDDIGYHGIIMPNGDFQIGRDVDNAGAHTFGFNTGSIGIMFVAGLADGASHTEPAPAQLKTARELINECEEYYPSVEVKGHRDLRPTLCPGFDIQHWMATGEVRA